MLLTLQNHGKWNKQQRNCKVGDVVLLKEDSEWNQWPMTKIVSVNSDSKGDVCSVRILVGAADKSDELDSLIGKASEQVGCACRK